VLLIAALILLPVIFDGDGSYQAPVETRIPAPPSFPEPARVIADRPVVIADTEQINLASVTETTDSDNSTDSDLLNDTDGNDADLLAQVSDAETDAAAEIASADTVAVSTAAANANLQLDNQGLPQGWNVRMGAFSVISNADALVQTLQAKELRAYSRSILVNNAPMAVVYIGPLIDRSAAQQLLDQMNKDYAQLPGKRIERFEIEDL
jgi:DedD protein